MESGLSHALSRRRALLVKLVVTAAVAAIALLRWDAGAAFFLALLVASACGLVDRRVSAVLGLLSLACCALLLTADQGAWLQRSPLVNYYAASIGLYSPSVFVGQVAVWAYYFLCISALAQLARSVSSLSGKMYLR